MPVGAIYLTDTSPGAPVLSGTNGTLCNVLDWALPQKGWAIEYTATNNRIYRPGAGNRNRMFVCHDSALSGSAQAAIIRGCENATAANAANLVNPFPTVAQVTNNTSTISTSNVTSTAARSYRIVLSDRFVIIAVSTQAINTGGWDMAMFGDLSGSETSDMWATICHISNNSNPGSATGRGLSTCTAPYPTSLKTFFCRSVDGTLFATRGCLATSAGPSSDFGAVSGVPPIKGGFANRVEREKIAANCIGSSTITPGPLAICKRGWVPNLWNPVHFGSGGVTSDDVFTDSAYAVGSSFNFIMVANNTGIAILEATDSWSPPVG